MLVTRILFILSILLFNVVASSSILGTTSKDPIQNVRATNNNLRFSENTICKLVGSLLYNKSTQSSFDGDLLPLYRGALTTSLLKSTKDLVRCWVPTIRDDVQARNETTTTTNIKLPLQLIHSDFGSVIVGKPYTNQKEEEACFLGCERMLYRISFQKNKNIVFNVLVITRPFKWICWLPVDKNRSNFKQTCIKSPRKSIPQKEIRSNCRDNPKSIGVKHNEIIQQEQHKSSRNDLENELKNIVEKVRNSNSRVSQDSINSRKSLSVVEKEGNNLLCKQMFEHLKLSFGERNPMIKLSGQITANFSGKKPDSTAFQRCAVRSLEPSGSLDFRTVRKFGDETCVFGCDVIRYRISLGSITLISEFLFMRVCTPYNFRTCAAPIGTIFQKVSPSFSDPSPTNTAKRLPIQSIIKITSSVNNRRRIINMALNKLRRSPSFEDVINPDPVSIDVSRIGTTRRYRVIFNFDPLFNSVA